LKNILFEKPLPYDFPSGRLKYSCDFVSKADIKGKVVLDIGCGFGWFELFCIHEDVGDIHSIEIDDVSISTARMSVVDPKVHFSIGDALTLPF
jgi:predicted RNA methylase